MGDHELKNEAVRIAAVVTGSASGIGAAVARRLAGPGVGLVLNTRSSIDKLNRVADEARSRGASVVVVDGDLAAADTAQRLVSASLESFGRLDQIVSNAGWADKRPFGTLQEADLVAAQAAMPMAFFRLVTHALPHLKRSDAARVVAISSFNAHRFITRGHVYPASASAKAGLEALAKSLAAQVAVDGITVNCVVPGYIRKDPGAHAALTETDWQEITDSIPARRLGLPDEVAAMVGFLLSRDAAYVTGQAIHVNGGLTL
jgi:NAD(P)-dependent dehydrogenase (short-subunit alcohol dehydrogenase family)